MGIKKMKCVNWTLFIMLGLSGCAFNTTNGSFSDSSIQTIDMGKFNGLRIIQIASLNYPELSSKASSSQVIIGIDKDNFNDSLIESLKMSNVRVLASAQTKIHLDFTKFLQIENDEDNIMIMSANVAVSRNGIITRKTIEISSLAKMTTGATKNHTVKKFIQALGEMLREQSTFKR
jgi:hypothetical protein